MSWKKKTVSVMLGLVLVLSFGFSSIVSATPPEVQLYDASYTITGPHGSSTFRGQIEVENLGFAKQVIVHYTTNGGTTWNTLNASYSKSIGSNREIWSFTTSMQYSLQFAVEYKVNGQSYWDNNGGSNYSLSFPNTNFALGVPNVINWTNIFLTGGTFSGDIVLKNLAYAKTVNVVYSTDNWVTTQTLSASYDSSLGNNLELWKFNTVMGPTINQIKYYISYSVSGNTYYDNNFGSNYTINK